MNHYIKVRNAWNEGREGRPSNFNWLFLAKESGSNRSLVATYAPMSLAGLLEGPIFSHPMNTMPKPTFQKLKSVPLIRI